MEANKHARWFGVCSPSCGLKLWIGDAAAISTKHRRRFAKPATWFYHIG